ncbi:MAG: F0F1 ATP synthase subunit C [Candidatus Thermoplasmatota archaeon]|nr:F0F1 ATP synthase subunit C [Candidatus Thermoplasmatota archaeon]|tara:strand:- start:207 stop:515 length:309 start_codon:yes stop_codon:yes gene_type:complete
MNNKKMIRGMSMMMVLLAIVLVASGVQAQEADNQLTVDAYAKLGAGIALGLAGVGTGLSQGPIGAAAVGMIAEDSSKFVTGLIFTALPETIVLFGFLAVFLL